MHVDTRTRSLSELSNPTIFGNGRGQPLTPAHDVFLPERKNFLLGLINQVVCPCRNRFVFLPSVQQLKAFRIEQRIDKGLGPRITAIRKEIEAAGEDTARLARVEEEIARFEAEREQQLSLGLRRAGIPLPADSAQDLKPRDLRLEIGKASGVDSLDVSALRAREVRPPVSELSFELTLC